MNFVKLLPPEFDSLTLLVFESFLRVFIVGGMRSKNSRYYLGKYYLVTMLIFIDIVASDRKVSIICSCLRCLSVFVSSVFVSSCFVIDFHLCVARCGGALVISCSAYSRVELLLHIICFLYHRVVIFICVFLFF